MLVPAEMEQTQTKRVLRVCAEDHFCIGIDQVKRRVVVHIAASPTRTNFMRRWILIMTEIAKLDIEKDAPIDVIYDYSEVKPVQPDLKVILFTKALRAGMLFPNVKTWRVIPGDPSRKTFLQKFSREMSSSWLPLRTNEKIFPSVEKAEGYLDELRARESKNSIGNNDRRLTKMSKHIRKVETFIPRLSKTDSAKWKDKTVKPLTHAQLRIRHLCDAYLKGEITPGEFERDLPPILDARDRERHSMDS